MKSSILRLALVAALSTATLLLPAAAQEADKEAAPPASAEPPAAPPKDSTPPKQSAPAAEESEVPPDLGENVSADNNVSFPVDI